MGNVFDVELGGAEEREVDMPPAVRDGESALDSALTVERMREANAPTPLVGRNPRGEMLV